MARWVEINTGGPVYQSDAFSRSVSVLLLVVAVLAPFIPALLPGLVAAPM
jgi:hypothetical protein